MSSKQNNELLKQLKESFSFHANPQKALGMQAYMKSQMPYWGIPMPLMRTLSKNIFKQFPLISKNKWKKTVLFLWNHASHREERYAALELAKDKRAKNWHTISVLPLYRSMIVSGAWWDFVDTMAHQLWQILSNDPTKMKSKMLVWSHDENIWVRRSAIICQLGAKEKTDFDFLEQCMKPSFSSKEFFLQKAIGWALRQYAWVNPQAVKKYLEKNRHQLSSLSYREASKNLQKLI